MAEIVSLERAREIKALRAKMPPHPRVILEGLLHERGLTLHDLALRMEGDKLRNLVCLQLYFQTQPAGRLRLGSVFIHRIAACLGGSPAVLEAIEDNWMAADAELHKAIKAVKHVPR